MEEKIVGQRCKQISSRNFPWVRRWKLLIIGRWWSIHSERSNNNEICCLSSGMQEDTTQLPLRRSKNGLDQVCLFLISTQPCKCVMKHDAYKRDDESANVCAWQVVFCYFSSVVPACTQSGEGERESREIESKKNFICIEIQSFRREFRTHCAQFLFCCNMEFIGRL